MECCREKRIDRLKANDNMDREAHGGSQNRTDGQLQRKANGELHLEKQTAHGNGKLHGELNFLDH